MQVTIEMPEALMIRVAKFEKDFEVPFAGFSPEVQLVILQAGLGRILGDAVAAKDATEANVLKKIDAWVKGEVRASSERESDPVKAEAMRDATARVTKAVVARFGKKHGWDASAIRAKAKELVAANPSILEAARAAVEAKKGLEIDIAL